MTIKLQNLIVKNRSSLTTVVVLILLAIIVICATVVFVVVRLRKKPRESRFFDAPPVRWSANRSSSNLSLDVQNEEERVRVRVCLVLIFLSYYLVEILFFCLTKSQYQNPYHNKKYLDNSK